MDVARASDGRLRACRADLRPRGPPPTTRSSASGSRSGWLLGARRARARRRLRRRGRARLPPPGGSADRRGGRDRPRRGDGRAHARRPAAGLEQVRAERDGRRRRWTSRTSTSTPSCARSRSRPSRTRRRALAEMAAGRCGRPGRSASRCGRPSSTTTGRGRASSTGEFAGQAPPRAARDRGEAERPLRRRAPRSSAALADAGFREIKIEREYVDRTYPSAEEWWRVVHVRRRAGVRRVAPGGGAARVPRARDGARWSPRASTPRTRRFVALPGDGERFVLARPRRRCARGAARRGSRRASAGSALRRNGPSVRALVVEHHLHARVGVDPAEELLDEAGVVARPTSPTRRTRTACRGTRA